MVALAKYQSELIEHSMAVGALMFGDFTLKSGRLVQACYHEEHGLTNQGRISPYFLNAGLLASGPVLNTLCAAYASTIADALKVDLPEFDILFGPAYKGIPFAAGTALLLHREHNIDVGFAYDRKEAKRAASRSACRSKGGESWYWMMWPHLAQQSELP